MNIEWLCIQCGEHLGDVAGGELTPSEKIPQKNLRTRGPNLVVVCPNCGSTKTWYTADPVVRALNQLVDAVATSLARRVIHLVSEQMLHLPK